MTTLLSIRYTPYYHTREAAISYARLASSVSWINGTGCCQPISRHQGNALPQPSARILAHREAVQSQLENLKACILSINNLFCQSITHWEEDAHFSELPPVKIVDMRTELREGNRSIFSRALLSALGAILQQDQQAILFINRRGTATFVFCRDCGHTLKCPRCEIPLTLHTPQTTLTCHYCGYKRNLPKSCPICRSSHIRHYGTGTERVEAEVQAQFPGVSTIRWDYESTRQKGGHDLILNHFINRQADILIGTQMVAKGLDLPLVTLVGVILADVGLSHPDYRAAERVYQVLTRCWRRTEPLGGT
jgi:primosomal protein N' (replication factor Y)